MHHGSQTLSDPGLILNVLSFYFYLVQNMKVVEVRESPPPCSFAWNTCSRPLSSLEHLPFSLPLWNLHPSLCCMYSLDTRDQNPTSVQVYNSVNTTTWWATWLHIFTSSPTTKPQRQESMGHIGLCSVCWICGTTPNILWEFSKHVII